MVGLFFLKIPVSLMYYAHSFHALQGLKTHQKGCSREANCQEITKKISTEVSKKKDD